MIMKERIKKGENKMGDLNRTVADFEYSGQKYEIDLLLDSLGNGFATYEIFDVTDDKKIVSIRQFELEQQEEDDYIVSDLIKRAKGEIDNE